MASPDQVDGELSEVDVEMSLRAGQSVERFPEAHWERPQESQGTAPADSGAREISPDRPDANDTALFNQAGEQPDAILKGVTPGP